MFFFISFFILHFQAEACDCEQIKKQKYCYVPSCIKQCDLESFFEGINSAFFKQCLPGRKKEEVFKKNKLSALWARSFIKNSKKKIERIEKEEKMLLERNCPYCSLFPELKAHFKVTSVKDVCPEKYLDKKYNYKKSFQSKRKQSSCNKEGLHRGLERYMENILEKNASVEARKLWTACPDPCSFDTFFSVRINESSCIGSIDFTVLCVNPNRIPLTDIPIYTATIKYKKGLQCKK